MPPEDIDDLFRDHLAGHATPPGDALWSRLQAQTPPAANSPTDATAEQLDHFFRKELHAHSTPVRRELWERLEDEHLRPSKRRAGAWWPMALAAALALLLIAGGAGLWLGFPGRSTQTNSVASQPDSRGTNSSKPGPLSTRLASPSVNNAVEVPAEAGSTAAQPAQLATASGVEKNNPTQATAPQALASTAPKARMSADRPARRHPLEIPRRSDAASAQSPLVARTSVGPAAPQTLAQPRAADEQRPQPESVVALNTPSATAAEIVPASTAPAPGKASTAQLITVEVRPGTDAVAQPSKLTSLLASGEEPTERRRLGGRLLHQAGNLVRGERVSLAEVTGLPETLTVRANVAGHSLTKFIQL